MIKHKRPPPYDYGWSWMIVLGSFIASFMSLGLFRSYGILLELVIDYFHVPTVFGVIPITVVALIFTFLGPLFIVLSDYYTPRRVVLFGSIMGFIGIAMSSRLFNIYYFIATFGVSFGIGASTLGGTGPLLISKYFIKRRSFATGLAMSGSSCGQFVMPLLIQYLLDEYALSGALLIMSGLFLQSLISSALYRPIESYDTSSPPVDTEEGQGHISNEMDTDVDGHDKHNITTKEEERNPFLDNHEHETEASVSSLPSNDEPKRLYLAENGDFSANNNEKSEMMKKLSIQSGPANSSEATKATKKPKFTMKQVLDLSVLKRVDSVFVALESFMCFFGLMSFMLFMPSIIKEKGYENYENAFLLSSTGIGDLIGRVGSGFLADWGFIERYRLQAGAVCGAGLTAAVCLFIDSYIGLVVICALFGFFSGTYIALYAPVVRDFFGQERMAKNFAFGLFLQGIGGATGQPLLAVIRDVTGSFSTVLVICCVCCSFGGILLFCYPVFLRLDQRLSNEKKKEPIQST